MNWNPDEYYKGRAVAADYDASRFSSTPGWVFDFLEKRTVAKCFSQLSKGRTIADAPCGRPVPCRRTSGSRSRVHGFDISEAMLYVARQRLDLYGEFNLRGGGNTRRADPSVAERCPQGVNALFNRPADRITDRSSQAEPFSRGDQSKSRFGLPAVSVALGTMAGKSIACEVSDQRQGHSVLIGEILYARDETLSSAAVDPRSGVHHCRENLRPSCLGCHRWRT